MYWFSDMYITWTCISHVYTYHVSSAVILASLVYCCISICMGHVQTLLTNKVGHGSLQSSMHGTHAVDHELCQQNGHVKENGNHVICHSASDPGSELVQTAPACWHSATWCRHSEGQWCDHQHAAWVRNPLTPSYHHQKRLGILIIMSHGCDCPRQAAAAAHAVSLYSTDFSLP
jgi:hypothetical protein